MSVKPKILFIGDPLSSLKLATDTSISFCETALNLDFEVFWCEKKDISFFNYEILVNRAFVITKASTVLVEHEEYEGAGQNKKSIPFSEFTYCFIRPNPPFDESYKDLCWILNTQTKVKICNPPSALLNFHEKSFQMRALAEGALKTQNLIPTCVTESIEIVAEFLNTQHQKGVQKFITKPWLGYAGIEVSSWDQHDDLLEFVRTSPHKLIVQPLLEEIHDVGDRRVTILNGNIAFSFVRIPPKDKIASNLAQGGSAVMRPMTPVQELLCQHIGKFLVKHSIVLAGIDLIGEKIGEINITSPTGFRTYEALSGTKITQKAFEEMIS